MRSSLAELIGSSTHNETAAPPSSGDAPTGSGRGVYADFSYGAGAKAPATATATRAPSPRPSPSRQSSRPRSGNAPAGSAASHHPAPTRPNQTRPNQTRRAPAPTPGVSTETAPTGQRRAAPGGGTPSPLARALIMAAGGLITGVGLIIAFTSGGDETALDTTDLDQAPPTSDPAPADVTEDDGLRPVENSLGSDVATSLTTPATEATADTTDSGNLAHNADSTSSTGNDGPGASSPDQTVTPDPVANAANPSGSTSSTGATTANPNLPIAAKPTETTGIPEGTDQGTNPTGSGSASTAPSSTTATTAPTTAAPTTVPTTAAPTSGAPTTAPETTAPPTPVEPAEPITGVWDYLGNPWVPSHLANLTLKGDQRYTYRFTAKHTGPMTGFINYMQANTSRTGYAGGNGGTIRFRLVPDHNGLPNDNTILAETTWNPNLNNGSAFPPGSTNHTDTHHISFAQKNWPTPPTLTAGTTYHLITENIHPNNTTNYISINNPYATSNHTRSPHGPQNQHWGITRNTGTGWHDYTTRNNGTARYEPNLLILMNDGNHYGNSYMESKNTYPINNTNHIRQTFTPTHTTTINQLSIFTTGTATLHATLTQNGTPTATWTTNTTGQNHNIINTGTHTLTPGTTYTLELKATNGTLNILTYRDGSLGNGNPYPQGGNFPGHSQHSTNSGQTWTNTFHTYADLAGVTLHTTN